jgi:hypothetical protein
MNKMCKEISSSRGGTHEAFWDIAQCCLVEVGLDVSDVRTASIITLMMETTRHYIPESYYLQMWKELLKE